MSRCRSAIPLVLAMLGFGAAAQAGERASATSAPADSGASVAASPFGGVAPVSAAPPLGDVREAAAGRRALVPAPVRVPRRLQTLLPPGARSEAARVRVDTVGDDETAPFLQLVERLAPLDATAPDGVGGAVEVEYTVDPALDQAVRELLAQRAVPLGHVIVMDPRTGEVFAYVSTDPERFPATRPYPTASLMKLVTAAALLRNAPDATQRPCRFFGSPYRLEPGDLQAPAEGGVVSRFAQALAISNNQCFARFAVHDLGHEKLLAEIRDTGLIESPAAPHDAGRVDPVEGELGLGLLGSGLGGSFVTPLAAARLAALLADGQQIHPYWIAGMRDGEGRRVAVSHRPAPRRVWDRELTRTLRQMLVEVTQRGTARRAFHTEDGRPLLGDIEVAGKTGSLSGRDPEGYYQWFVGVAPAESPRLAIATLVVNGPEGGTSASEIAAWTLHRVFCEDDAGRCDAAGAERLHARSRQRELHHQREIAARAEALIAAQQRAEEEIRLDRPPQPIGRPRLELPRPLRERSAHGEIVLLLDLSPEGEILDVTIASSDLPQFDAWLVREVRRWRFTPPTHRGRPVEARARLPIPIHVD